MSDAQTLERLTTAFTKLSWYLVPLRAVELYRELEPAVEEAWEKQAYSPGLRRLGEWLNLYPGTYPGGIPNHPAPLTSMLVGGLAGAGLGYGAGALGETLLPRTWNKGRLRRTLAMLGGAAGIMPGMIWGGVNKVNKLPFNSNQLFQERGYQPPPSQTPANPYRDYFRNAFDKASSLTGAFNSEPIPVDEFNRVIWHDPRVAGPLPPQLQAAASGLIAGAANLPGRRDAEWVTPLDVARMAAGMGAGYLSGAMVGKALGLLLGMPDPAQERLKNTGTWAGILTSLIPIAFGG